MAGMSRIKYAEMFARGAHAGQKHGDRPYWKHLQDVTDVLKRMGVTDEPIWCAAWLHDTVEDTPVTYQDLKQLFGEEVAELVWRVTDELGRNRKERKEKTWPKTAETSASLILKLADLAANVEACFREPSKLQQMYRKEWPEMKERFTHALTVHHLVNKLDWLDHLGSLINGDVVTWKEVGEDELYRSVDD